MRTYGTLYITERLDDSPFLVFRVEPHVAMRLRRFFRAVESTVGDELTLDGTAANLVDMDWFLARYPMDVRHSHDADGRAWLAARAANARKEAEIVASVLDGTMKPIQVTMALPARDYQAVAAEMFVRKRRLLLADSIGLGKSVSAITALARPELRPALVVTQPHLCEQFAREVRRFLPGIEVHVGKKTEPVTTNAEIIILSYYKLDGWRHHLAGKIKTLVLDEGQEVRRTGTKKWNAAKALADEAEYCLLMSATPIHNYGGEFWNVLRVVAPDVLGSRDEFHRTWCGSAGNFAGSSTLVDPKAFGAFLQEQQVMLRRTRKEVGRELPSLTRVVEYVEHDRLAIRKYESKAVELAKAVMAKQGTPFEQMRDAQELSAQARLATGLAKAGYVADFVKMLVEETGEKVLLFGWHHGVYRAWKERLAPHRLAWHTGRETPAAKRKELDRFIDGDAQILIMSLRSGQGVDGIQKACSQVVIGELDWSPGVLEQCCGRAHRDGQAEPVMLYYLLATEGADPVMADVLGLKGAQLAGVHEPFGTDAAPLEADPDHVRRLAASYLARYEIPIPDLAPAPRHDNIPPEALDEDPVPDPSPTEAS